MSDAADPFQPYEGREPYLFISYSRADSGSVEQILHSLAAQGVRIWWDRALEPGQDYGAKLEQRVDACAGLVVFLSPNSIRKKQQNWVLSETKHAAEASKEIIPVVLEDCKPPLDWKSLVDHLQQVDARSANRSAGVAEIMERARRLGCCEATSLTPNGPPDLSGRGREKPPRRQAAPLHEWLRFIDRVNVVFKRTISSEAPPEPHEKHLDHEFDFGDEGPAFSAAREGPLAIDTEPRFDRCRKLIGDSADLLDPRIPISDRLECCLTLTKMIPDSRLDSEISLALRLCHLSHLAALARIHADAGEPPSAESISLLRRIEAVTKDCIEHRPTAALKELSRMVDFDLRIARLELVLMAGPPESRLLNAAKSKGTLAYTRDWRDRITEAEQTARELRASGFEACSSPGIVAAALRRVVVLAQWLNCSYSDLRRPGNISELPTRRANEALGMHYRGAALTYKLRKRISAHRLRNDLCAHGILLFYAYRPALDSRWGWSSTTNAQEASIWLRSMSDQAKQDSALVTRVLESHECCLLLADLLRRHPGDLLRDFFNDGTQYARDLLVHALADALIRQGGGDGDRWIPATWMADDRLRILLWLETRRAIVHDKQHATDVLFLAGTCAPNQEKLDEARGELWLSGDAARRAVEIVTNPVAVPLPPPRAVPTRYIHPQSQRFTDDLRKLFRYEPYRSY